MYTPRVSDLVAEFTAAWPGSEAPNELATRLSEMCALARSSHPDLPIDEGDLVAAIARRCPSSQVVEYLDRCHVAELALTRVARCGDAAAVAAIESRYRRTIQAVCHRFTSRAYSVDDLWQLLREKLFAGPDAGIGEYSGHGPLGNWLRITAIRLFMDLGRRKDRARELPASETSVAALPHPCDLGLELVKREYRSAVGAAIEHAANRLGPGDRHLLRQHFVTGLTIDQIAVAVGIHRSTAARRIAKARAQLSALVREALKTTLAAGPDTLDEIYGLVVSGLDLSIAQLLSTQSRPTDPDSPAPRDQRADLVSKRTS
jgi:RNA polymerase sigma-70 factor (ECF subfamily)